MVAYPSPVVRNTLETSNPSSKIYGRAKELCEGLSVDGIASKKGVDFILGTLFKRDPLSVVSVVFQEF